MSNRDNMKQGEEYEEEGSPTPKQGNKVEVLSSSARPEIPVKLLAIVGGAIVALVLIYFAYNHFLGGEDEEALEEDFEGELIEDEFEDELIFEFAYTEEEWAMLREAGFSDSEIVQYESNQTEPGFLVEQSKEAMEKQVRDMYAELKKDAIQKGSDGFKNLLNNTWLGLDPKTIKGSHEETYDTYIMKENVSYTKIGVRGHQPLLKLKSHEFGTLYHMADPLTYMELRESGNIVIEYMVYNINGLLVVDEIRTEIVDSIPTIE